MGENRLLSATIRVVPDSRSTRHLPPLSYHSTSPTHSNTFANCSLPSLHPDSCTWLATIFVFSLLAAIKYTYLFAYDSASTVFSKSQSADFSLLPPPSIRFSDREKTKRRDVGAGEKNAKRVRRRMRIPSPWKADRTTTIEFFAQVWDEEEGGMWCTRTFSRLVINSGKTCSLPVRSNRPAYPKLSRNANVSLRRHFSVNMKL